MDFSQVKSLTIPEGEVTKITDSSGNVLWQKITQGWHTVWEGSQKIGTDGQESSFLFGNVPYSDSLKLRISFSELKGYSTWGDGKATYVPSDKVSPVTYESSSFTNNHQNTLIRAKFERSGASDSYQASLYYYKDTGNIDGYSYGINEHYAKAYIIITKVEA